MAGAVPNPCDRCGLMTWLLPTICGDCVVAGYKRAIDSTLGADNKFFDANRGKRPVRKK